MNTIRAIETHYKGYRFRSRLEARWAVFFDAMGLKWEYEPEGYVTSAGPYLPDFRVWTPQGEPMWYEVKPAGVLRDEKFNAFCETLPKSVRFGGGPRFALLAGDPLDFFAKKPLTPGHSYCGAVCPLCGRLMSFGSLARIEDRVKGGIGVWCEPCGDDTDEEKPRWESRYDPIPTSGVLGFGILSEFYWMIAPPALVTRVKDAADRARAARFEHGERG